MKVITPLTIDSEIKRQAKENMWNMSEIAEQAIRDKLNAPKVEEVLVCEFCGERGEKETAEETKEAEHKCKLDGKEGKSLDYSNPTSLTWLFNYQQWICNRCLKDAISKISNN